MAEKVEYYETQLSNEDSICNDPSHCDLRQRLDAEISEHKQTILDNDKEFQVLFARISMLEQQLQSSTQEQVSKLNESASFIERLNSRIESLNEEVSSERNEKLKAETLCKSFASKLHQVQIEKEQLKFDFEESESQVKMLKTKISEVLKFKQMLNSEEIRSQALEDDKALLQERLNSMQMVSKTNAKLSNQVKEQQGKITELERELASKTQRLEVFRNYKSTIDSKSKKISEDLKNINEELLRENSRLKQELQDTTEELKEKDKEIKRLSNETNIQLI